MKHPLEGQDKDEVEVALKNTANHSQITPARKKLQTASQKANLELLPLDDLVASSSAESGRHVVVVILCLVKVVVKLVVVKVVIFTKESK